MAKKTDAEKLEAQRKLNEKREAENHVRYLDDLRRAYINDPTVLYVVGNRVQHGAIYESIVVAVLDGGKILELKERINPGRDDNPAADGFMHRLMYVPWHSVEPYRTLNEKMAIQEFHVKDDIYVEATSRCIDGIVGMHWHFGVDFDPDYQRGNVWTLEDKVALIHSIFNNIDIGKFVFIKLPYKDNSHSYEILDGKQRLTALIEFMEGRFTYRGKTFFELHPYDQNHLENYSVAVGQITGVVTAEQKYRYFLKLNVSGHAQDPKHIAYVEELHRKALEAIGKK